MSDRATNHDVRAPHFLRFARAIALVSSVALPGCYLTHTLEETPPPRDAGTRDAARVDAPTDPCASCYDPGACGGWEGPGREECIRCCPVIGPLHPPDLPA